RDARAIAPDGLDVREQMVREGYRLRALKVGVAGHDSLDLVRRPGDEGPPELPQGIVQRIERVEGEEAEVERDLVVAAARGVQRAADGPVARRQGLHDAGVNDFRGRRL